MSDVTIAAANGGAKADKTSEGNWHPIVTSEDSITRRCAIPGGWLYRIDRVTTENVAGNEQAMVGRFAGFKTVFVPASHTAENKPSRWELYLTSDDSVIRTLDVPGGKIFRTDRIAPGTLNGNERFVVGRFAGFDAVFIAGA